MISEKWRARFRKIGRALVYVAAVVYLLALDDEISSMRSDISSIQSDISSIQSDVSSMQTDVSNLEDGTCRNSKICQ
jgi:cell division protein FtsL